MAIFWWNFKNNCVKNGYLGLPASSVGRSQPACLPAGWLAGRAFRFNLF
jgi:hypothetical protein